MWAGMTQGWDGFFYSSVPWVYTDRCPFTAATSNPVGEFDPFEEEQLQSKVEELPLQERSSDPRNAAGLTLQEHVNITEGGEGAGLVGLGVDEGAVNAVAKPVLLAKGLVECENGRGGGLHGQCAQVDPDIE